MAQTNGHKHSKRPTAPANPELWNELMDYPESLLAIEAEVKNPDAPGFDHAALDSIGVSMQHFLATRLARYIAENGKSARRITITLDIDVDQPDGE